MSVVFDFIVFVFESLENLAYVEHDGQNLTIDILLLAPEITDKNSLCIVEHLTPLSLIFRVSVFQGLFNTQTLL